MTKICEHCQRDDLERSCFLGIATKQETKWLCPECADLYFEIHERFFEDFILNKVCCNKALSQSEK